MKTILFNPFERYSEKTLLIVGFAFTLIGSYIAYSFNIRFDGLIDIHTYLDITFIQVLLDNTINVFSAVLLLFITAKYINNKTRLVDIITVSLIARIPYYFLPFFNINNALYKSGKEIEQLVNPELIDQISFSSLLLTIVFIIFSILFLVWYIALLFNGFKVASNAKGVLHSVLFSIAILLAEILSRVLISEFIV